MGTVRLESRLGDEGRATIDFDGNWKFRPGDDGRASVPDFNDSSWRTLDLPHDFSIELPRVPDAPCKREGGYFQTGIAWYRKTFGLPKEWHGRLESRLGDKVVIEFDGIYMNSEVWLNGNYLGKRPFGYVSFHCDLTPYLEFGTEKNILAVKVDNSKQQNSRWYSGSGIYRHVRLTITDPVHIVHRGIYVTTPEISASTAKVCIRTVVENESGKPENVTLKTGIVDPAGNSVGAGKDNYEIAAGQKYEFSRNVNVDSPQLWSPDTPRLYRARVEIIVDKKMADVIETPFGIRSIHFDAQTGFTLNGKSLKLKGACVHHDNGPLGSASYDRAEERKIELLKANGYNAFRTSHNPPAPALLDACDRLGMVVIDEAFDVWRKCKLTEDYSKYFDEWWQQDLDSMLYRDRNHPCVVIWSIGNELVERGLPEGARIAKMLADHVRIVDPTRPITAAICGVEGNWRDTDGLFAELDIGGYNYQRGNYRPDHERLPDRIMVATESNPPEAFDYWMDVIDLPYVIGDFVWTGYDYLGEACLGNARFEGDGLPENNAFPWHQANCGDLDLCGFKRPQSYYRDILWDCGNKLYIAVHRPIPEGKKEEVNFWGWPDVRSSWTWPGYEGKEMKVDIYSGCEKVELLLNGKSIGSQATSRETRFMATFTVSYEPGELKAVGYAGGQKIAEYRVCTADEPALIRLTPDRNKIKAEQGDLSFVTVEVLDRNGLLQPNASNLIRFNIEGEGVITGAGNADPVSTENYYGNQRCAFRGRCLVVVKSTGKAGKIRLRADADGLKSAETVIQVK